jgi:protein O-mannosyl-transferase
MVRPAASRPVSGGFGRLALPLVIVGAPLVVFGPSLANGFVWDDHFNLIANRDYRGLGWTQVMWMLTSAHLAHWIPVTWLTLGVDYTLWGMWPTGYHLSNILFHAANAWVFYLVARYLVRAAMPGLENAACAAGATAAALFFAVHPLRVESVAWITERRDLVSGLFLLLAVLAYLHACAGRVDPTRWRVMSLVCFQLAVLSKAIVVTLPVVLLILDVYPLKRFGLSVRRWTGPASRGVLGEKLLYLPMAILGSFVAISTFGKSGGLTSLDKLPLLDRVAAMLYSAWFYVWKTAVPFGLSPLYEMPPTIDLFTPRFVIAIIGTLGMTVLTVVVRRRWPAALAAWLIYLCLLAPVSGGMHNGRHLVADRNTYLACLPWALLFGGAVAAIVHAGVVGAVARYTFRLASSVLAAWLVALAALSSLQTTAWRDDEALWRHALAADPRCFTCHHNLGTALATKGLETAAIPHFRRAVALRPAEPVPHGALVIAYLATGAEDSAAAELATLGSLDPGLARDLSPAFLTAW